MISSSNQCPICHHNCARLQRWGSYANHAIERIAGIEVAHAKQRFALLKCSNCRFVFKSPQPSERELISLYSKSTDRAAVAQNNLADPPTCKRINLLAQLTEAAALAHTNNRKVLEVGCSNGMMLSQWGDKWDKFGVEPSEASARLAHKRGVKVLSSNIFDITSGTWDCIVSVDTIEHMNNPLKFFEHAKSLLSPGGIILTLTGNISHFLAKYAEPRYWYASFPEHISFLSPFCMQYIAQTLNGRVLLMENYRWGTPGRIDCMEWLIQSTKFCIFSTYLATTRLSKDGLRSSKRGFPVMTAHKDHFLTVMGDFA